MGRLQLDNAIAFRKDQRMLYFKDKDGWKPIQVMSKYLQHWWTQWQAAESARKRLFFFVDTKHLHQIYSSFSLDALMSQTTRDQKCGVSACSYNSSSPSSHFSPLRKSQTELVCVGMERCKPSTERSVMMETRLSPIPVSVSYVLPCTPAEISCRGWKLA